MRAGGCSVQQTLTPEAATVVKQAISLARRRGHAQVTPLHVANTMLSSSAGLLRAACLQSHSHPLQCKALELCFNVALNRLPASSLSVPMLGLPQAHHHLHPPSLSNALVAAFKRAQAHQRRGSVETQQQQPLLAVKIELEQLVISILDDPSVSRVMREAGFSSTQVKSSVEQAVSVEICSPIPPTHTPPPPPPPTGKSRSLVQVKNEDVMSVIDALVGRRKKSLVIVGECLATAESVVGGVRDRVHKGEVPEVSRNLQFITLPLFSFRQMPAEEVDRKVGELRCFVKSCCVETGVVLFLKDLDWAAEYRASRGEKGRSYYCSLEHILMEIKNLALGGIVGEQHSNDKIWLMAIATYQTYSRFCRIGSPSLETLLGLQPLTVPAGGLGLSLNFDSQIRSKIGGVQFLPPAPDEIGSSEVPSLHINSCGSLCSMSSSLPSWLQRCKEESKRDQNSGDQGRLQLKELCRQWKSICTSTHKSDNHPSEITFNFSSVSPSSSSNISSYDGHSRSLHQNQQPSLLPRKSKRPWSEHRFCLSEEAVDEVPEQQPGIKAQENAGQKLSTFPCLYLNSHPNSNSSGSTMQTELSSKFKELNAENFKFLCNALERKVTWQQDIIPEIASIILQCRSGLMRRKGKSKSLEKREETWLLFQGSDAEGKERIGRELARLVFGSSTDFITVVGHSNLSSTQSDSTDVLLQIKRSRAEASHSHLQSLFEAVRENPHRVIMMEDIEQVDHYTLTGIKRATERGKLQSYGGDEVGLCDAIIILSCESFDSRSRACSPLVKQRAESEDEKEVDAFVSLDLNLCAADEDLDDYYYFDSAGLLECVDRAFFFNLPDVL
ncbi:hypothetical protein OPV22_031230 [Ensete ventricosum]|uniref:Clp R domain-containing protein n=1 Tax=Ensete ventricosum TaxID=4639 RepID=A0AAV8PIT9_ENSVE|nr:hypothetical protein OPV22_031230 [Ensete ventricosum]